MGDGKNKPKKSELERNIERLRKKSKKSITAEELAILLDLERQAQLLNR